MGFIAHVSALISIMITSIWLWSTYDAGTLVKTSKTSSVGIAMGPDEESIDNFYLAAQFMKWFMWTLYWIVPGLFTGDIWISQPSNSKSVVNWWNLDGDSNSDDK